MPDCQPLRRIKTFLSRNCYFASLLRLQGNPHRTIDPRGPFTWCNARLSLFRITSTAAQNGYATHSNAMSHMTHKNASQSHHVNSIINIHTHPFHAIKKQSHIAQCERTLRAHSNWAISVIVLIFQRMDRWGSVRAIKTEQNPHIYITDLLHLNTSHNCAIILQQCVFSSL